MSSLRTQGPIPRCPIDKSEIADIFQNNWRRGVWVPAFAGTTALFGTIYCTLSATNRNSPSPFETNSSTDFLPSFLS